MLKRICLFLFLSQLIFPVSVIASYEYAVIATQKKATIIKQQLKPLFTNQAVFSAKGYQLIVKASPSVINEIKHLLKQIDTPLQNLLIQVASERTIARELQLSNLSGNYQTQNKNNRGSVTIISTQRRSDKKGDAIYQARSIENSWVNIYTGKDVPYYSSNGYHLRAQTEFKNINSGFEAKAQLKSDNQVIIDIRVQNNQQNKNDTNSINTRSTETTISGNLGEWISLSQINNEQHKNNSRYGIQNRGGNTHYSTRTEENQENIYIKITTIQ